MSLADDTLAAQSLQISSIENPEEDQSKAEPELRLITDATSVVLFEEVVGWLSSEEDTEVKLTGGSAAGKTCVQQVGTCLQFP